MVAPVVRGLILGASNIKSISGQVMIQIIKGGATKLDMNMNMRVMLPVAAKYRTYRYLLVM